jgi:hypothetical protein
MAEKAVWDKTTVKHFCDICRDEVLAGHRPLGHFNKVGWKNLEVKFAERTGQKLEHLQLKNKCDNLKRSYTCFMELKHAATGLGWDDARKTVECDEAWWNEHLQVSGPCFYLNVFISCHNDLLEVANIDHCISEVP